MHALQKFLAIGVVSAVLSPNVYAEARQAESIPKGLSSSVEKAVREAENRLERLSDCELLVQIYDSKDANFTQLGYCFHALEEKRGIYALKMCIAVLIEPQTSFRHPFYGSTGHWGIEGPCDLAKLKAKFDDPLIDTTVNPISDMRGKQKQGKTLRLLRDRLALWPEILKKLSM